MVESDDRVTLEVPWTGDKSTRKAAKSGNMVNDMEKLGMLPGSAFLVFVLLYL